MKRPGSPRILSFGIGLVAVITLTVMNVYSLLELSTSTIESAREDQIDNIERFAQGMRHYVSWPAQRLYSNETRIIQRVYSHHNDLPESFKKNLRETMRNRLYAAVYFSPHDLNHCEDPENPIYTFNSRAFRIEEVSAVEDAVCEGISLARSSYNLRNERPPHVRMTFDTHRSMTLTYLKEDQTAFGHFIFMIDYDHLVNNFLPWRIDEHFGDKTEASVVVWIRERGGSEIITTSDETADYDRESLLTWKEFPDVMSNWMVDARYIETPAVAAANSSLIRNLIVLGTAVFALFGAMLFMYVTSKRERELAQRQAGFLANITHEFKTPLAAMQAAGENILDGRVSSGTRLKTYGSHIYNESIRLRKMIDQLLDIARIDSGQSMVQDQVLDLGTVTKSYFESHSTYVKSKGFAFHLKIEDEDTLPPIKVDPDHIETIVSNLVENAVKYSTEKKEINLTVRHSDDRVELLVQDKGIGIPVKLQKQIFDKFYRVEDSMTARTKGHGLGLSIVRNLTELNGGTIRVNSEPGKGSTFILVFPVAGEEDTKDRPSPVQNASEHAEMNTYDAK